MEMTVHRASRYTLALALLGLPAAAGAQAFGLNEIGSCALARGFAATAIPCDDASSIYWNPGAMPRTRGYSAYGGAAIIKIDGDFTQDTSAIRWKSDVPTAVVPHAFVTYRGAGKMAYGVGLYVPYGLTSQWTDDFPGRFLAKKASLQTIYVQPNLTYQVSPEWSVGGGPVFGRSTVELVQAIDLSTIPTSSAPTVPPPPTFGQLGIPARTEFARATLKGSASAFGFALGVHGKPNPDWEIGARFLSQLAFSYDDANATFERRSTGLTLAANNPFGQPAGTPPEQIAGIVALFSDTGLFAPQKVKTQIRHPAQIQAGLGYTGFLRTTLSAEYTYVGWRSFNVLPVNFQGRAPSRTLIENYNNTSSLRLGWEHRLLSGTALRAGFAAATAAAPDETVTPLLPEQDRALAMLGAGLPLGTSYVVDVTYAHIFTGGRRGRIDERSPTSTPAQATALNSGAYTLRANILSLSLKATF
jgi:long-chain fatty acid transport protein